LEINSELNVGTTVTVAFPVEKVAIEPVVPIIEEMKVEENE